jgi:hypothetical protein
MPSHHPFTVHVLNSATGEPLEEYKVSKTGTQLECYIESTVGTEFLIAVELADNFRDVNPTFGVWCNVDGTEIDDKILGVLGGRVKQSTTLSGLYLGNRQWRGMKFANTRFAGILPTGICC